MSNPENTTPSRETLAYWGAAFLAFGTAWIIYHSHQSDKLLRFCNTNLTTKTDYTLTLKSIDYDNRIIKCTLETDARKTCREVIGKFDFSHYIHTMRGTTFGGDRQRLTLKPVEPARNEGNDHSVPSEYGVYTAEVDWPFATDTHSFPNDDIQLAFSIEPDLVSSVEGVVRDYPAFCMVRSFIPDYALVEGVNNFVNERMHPIYITLKRDESVIWLAILTGGIGLFSSWMLVKKARYEKVELAALTYFGGLWAARSIVLSPLKGNVPFPTNVDLAVIFLFCFTIFGIAVSGYFRLKGESVHQPLKPS